MRLAAGILTIIGSCFGIIAGLFYLLAFVAQFFSYWYAWMTILIYLIIGVFGILAFAFGLAAGIYALKRSHLSFALFGMSWMIASGILILLPLWFFGLPMVILAIISVVFTAIARSDFKKPYP